VKKVVHIEHQTGPRGGESWFLTLECGHHKSVPMPRFRPNLDLVLVKVRESHTPRRKKFTAPKSCKCPICEK
jgi:hypothetical protein